MGETSQVSFSCLIVDEPANTVYIVIEEAIDEQNLDESDEGTDDRTVKVNTKNDEKHVEDCDALLPDSLNNADKVSVKTRLQKDNPKSKPSKIVKLAHKCSTCGDIYLGREYFKKHFADCWRSVGNTGNAVTVRKRLVKLSKPRKSGRPLKVKRDEVNSVPRKERIHTEYKCEICEEVLYSLGEFKAHFADCQEAEADQSCLTEMSVDENTDDGDYFQDNERDSSRENGDENTDDDNDDGEFVDEDNCDSIDGNEGENAGDGNGNEQKMRKCTVVAKHLNDDGVLSTEIGKMTRVVSRQGVGKRNLNKGMLHSENGASTATEIAMNIKCEPGEESSVADESNDATENTSTAAKRRRVTKAFYCQNCGGVYLGKSNFQKHVVLCEEGIMQNDECCDCGMTFEIRASVKRRRRTVGQQSRCFKCKALFKKTRHAEKQRQNRNMKAILCELCGKRFSAHHHLKAHVLTHTGNRPYKCEHCTLSFYRKDYLHRHYRVHGLAAATSLSSEGLSEADAAVHAAAGKTLHRCTQCQAIFIEEADLQCHEERHGEQANFMCDQCPKTFRRKQHLDSHYQIHNQEKPYPCEHCSASFTQKRQLQQHSRTHKEEAVALQMLELGRGHETVQVMKVEF